MKEIVYNVGLSPEEAGYTEFDLQPLSRTEAAAGAAGATVIRMAAEVIGPDELSEPVELPSDDVYAQQVQ